MQVTSDTRSEPSLRQSTPDPVEAMPYERTSHSRSTAGPELPPQRRARRRASRWRWLLWAVLIAVAVAALVSVLWQPQVIEQIAPAAEAPTTEPATPPAPIAQGPIEAPRYPIGPVAEALPPLDASDESLLKAMEMLWIDGGGITSYLAPTNLVRNFVATVDNIPRQTWAAQRFPVKPPVGVFGTTRNNDEMVGNPANAMRYAPYVRLLESVDTPKLVALYVRNYPLFQEAFRELGYPRGNFNDRLVDAIDTMIAAPEVPGPIALTQPKVLYQFADSELEQLPAGQKLMLRMGPEHAKTVKAKLREVRKLLTANGPASAKAPVKGTALSARTPSSGPIRSAAPAPAISSAPSTSSVPATSSAPAMSPAPATSASPAPPTTSSSVTSPAPATSLASPTTAAPAKPAP